MILDAHQHFWRYTTEEFGWISDEMEAIRRDFLPGELEGVMRVHGVDGTIAVQARQTLKETRWLLELARKHSWIVGVVGWLELKSPTLPETVESLLSDSSALVGARHVLQAEDEAFFADPDFNRGLEVLSKYSLVYDLLVSERQLPAAIAMVNRHPSLTFVLDHLGKPDLPPHANGRWKAHLRELARRERVICKISGGITEADPRWAAAAMTPLFDVALDAFGPGRLMFGSNWPVSQATGGYDLWMRTVRDWGARLGPDEQRRLFGATAQEVYRLES